MKTKKEYSPDGRTYGLRGAARSEKPRRGDILVVPDGQRFPFCFSPRPFRHRWLENLGLLSGMGRAKNKKGESGGSVSTNMPPLRGSGTDGVGALAVALVLLFTAGCKKAPPVVAAGPAVEVMEVKTTDA